MKITPRFILSIDLRGAPSEEARARVVRFFNRFGHWGGALVFPEWVRVETA